MKNVETEEIYEQIKKKVKGKINVIGLVVIQLELQFQFYVNLSKVA